MGYLFANACVDDGKIYEYVASSCPLLSADGLQSIQCVATSTGVTVSITELATNTTTSYSHAPALINCDTLTMEDAVTMAWLVVLAWAAAWAIKMVAQTIRER